MHAESDRENIPASVRSRIQIERVDASPDLMSLRLALTGALVLTVLIGGVGLVGPTEAPAQVRDSIPRISDAERLFEEGVAAFEKGRYERAYDRFRLVTEHALNRRTTAALLMGGKALLRLGRYEEAVDRLETLLERYSNTTYREAAEAALEVARERLEVEGRRADTLRIGVALPLGEDEVPLSQALFNGIRLAIDEHNGVRRRYVSPPGLESSADTFEVYDTANVHGDSLAQAEGQTTVATPTDTAYVDSLRVVTERVRRPGWVAKMHFRHTGTGASDARAAVDSLVQRDRVDIILGPIRSSAARPAAERADEHGVLLVAPVATEESVSEGHEYVFQANPTISLRGRIMARLAAESLLLESAGVIYERGHSLSERMAEGFQAAAEEEGLDVPFVLPLERPRDWARLPEVVAADSAVTDSLVRSAEGLYLPVAGDGSTGKIRDALSGLDRLHQGARVLGNAQWHDLPFRKQASAFTATYTNDFYVQTGRPEVQQFIDRYRLLTGTTPSALSVSERRLAFTGYDVARFVLSALSPSEVQPEALRTAPQYEGLGLRIDFRGGNVNQTMFLHRYRNRQIELLR